MPGHPAYSEIYMMYVGNQRGAFIATRVESEITSTKLMRGEEAPTSPVHAKWCMGGKVPQEFVKMDGALLVRESVLKLWREEGVTGWTTYPVNLFGRNGEEIGGYSGVAFVGRCGRIQPARSRVEMRGEPGRQYKANIGIYWDEQGWDGSDVFMAASGEGFRFLRDRVKRGLETARFKGVEFDRVDEVELGEWP